ncbi:hypothetical protein M0R45_012690 [Rubus argutus]|uniref:RING-type domain-containing protein n=1 Tax=Rubus argutus TaxID=59490 RepID=A0AAW1XHC8_RUBAR
MGGSKLRKAAKKMVVAAANACGGSRRKPIVFFDHTTTTTASISGSSAVSPSNSTEEEEECIAKETESAAISTNNAPSSNKNLCAICLDPLSYHSKGKSSAHAIFTAQCSHAFHFSCISSNVRHGSVTCPICRAHWTQLPRNLIPPGGSLSLAIQLIPYSKSLMTLLPLSVSTGAPSCALLAMMMMTQSSLLITCLIAPVSNSL